MDNKEDKLKKIHNTLWVTDIFIWNILEYVSDKWWNMVVSCEWIIYFNKAWTSDVDWSFRDVKRENIWCVLEEQSDEIVDFVYSLIDN